MNLYYYIYYIFVISSSKLNKRNAIPYLDGSLFLTLTITLGIITLISFVFGKYFVLKYGTYVLALVPFFIAFSVNYLVLLRNDKYKKIIDTYNAKFEHTDIPKFHIFLVWFVFALNFALCIFVAKIVRETIVGPA
jgi:hypothetical protein